MEPLDVYKQQRALGWTRVDMLLALYDAAIRDLHQAIEAYENENKDIAQQKRLHASRIVVQLQVGLDFDYGEIPQRIAQLCEFVQHCLLTGGLDEVKSALKVLGTLRDAFATIRDEAVSMEAAGQIPRLGEVVDCQHSA